MIRFLSLMAAVVVGATMAYAQLSGGAAIKEREAVMKAMGKASKSNAQMLKGEIPFDAATAKTNFETIAADAIKSKALFPDDSKTGETKAKAEVWAKKDDFLAKFDKLAADAKAAAAAVSDKGSLMAQVKAVGSNCGGCHKVYREKD